MKHKLRLVGLHGSLGHDGRKGNGKVSKGRGVGRLQLHIYRIVVHYVNLVDKVHDIGNSRGIDGSLQGEFHVLSLHLRTVMELHALADIEGVGGFGILGPALRDLGLKLSGGRVNHGQGVENLVRHLNGRGLLTLMGVKGGHVRALRPYQGVLVLSGAASCCISCGLL